MLSTFTHTSGSGSAAHFYAMRASDALATATTLYAIPLLVLLTTGSSSLTGIAFVVEWTPRLAAFTLAGRLVDRHGAARVSRVSNAARAVVLALVAAALTVVPEHGAVPTTLVLAAGATCGLLAQTSYVAVESLGASLTREAGERGHHVQAVQTGIDQIALLIGPLLGGLLLTVNRSLLLGFIALLAVGAANLTSVRLSAVPAQRDTSSLRNGLRTLRGIRPLCWLITGLAVSNLATGVLEAGAPITVVGHFHRSTAAVGVLWSVAAVVSLAAVFPARRAIDRWQVWPVGAVAAGAATAACAGTAAAPAFAPYAAGVALVMASENTLVIVLRSLRARLIPTRGFGSTLAASIILMLLPLPLAGVLVAAIPAGRLPTLLLACALLQGAALGACFTVLRRHRSELSLLPPPTEHPPSAPAPGSASSAEYADAS